MKKRVSIALSAVFITSLFISTAYDNNTITTNQLVKNKLLEGTEALLMSLDNFTAFCKSSSNQEVLKEQYLELRKSYKAIEYLIAYLQPELVNDKINGAPLPKLERNVAELVVLEPKGLQVIDEELFADSIAFQNIYNLSSALRLECEKLSLYFSKLLITDRQVFEAMRYGIIRHYTLGVTGFDTPGSLLAMEDAVEYMKGIYNGFRPYQREITSVDSQLSNEITNLFTGAIKYLQLNRDFEQFDRLAYLKNYINPLYGKLLEVQLKLNIETIYEVNNRKIPINYMANSLFAPDFLNPYYFTNLQPEQHTAELENLGRTLFFDPILSSNGQRSCASCHNPSMAFTDGNQKSLAFDLNGTVSRNSPGLINAVFADRFFYDLRAQKLEEQFEHVVVSDKEFHTDFKGIEDRLKSSQTYVELFKFNFPDYQSPIFKYSISMALSAYVVSLKGFNSAFDRYVRGESITLNEDAKKGFNLFMGKANCGTCHFAPNFSGLVPPLYAESESEVLGVPENNDKTHPKLDQDQGRRGSKVVSEASEIYLHSFKTVTVRNVQLTAPYMHNGVFSTLDEVIEFYEGGGGAGLGFNLHNQTLGVDSLKLSAIEKNQLKAFMNSLTDTSGLTKRPISLPQFENMNSWNNRVVGGNY